MYTVPTPYLGKRLGRLPLLSQGEKEETLTKPESHRR